MRIAQTRLRDGTIVSTALLPYFYYLEEQFETVIVSPNGEDVERVARWVCARSAFEGHDRVVEIQKRLREK